MNMESSCGNQVRGDIAALDRCVVPIHRVRGAESGFRVVGAFLDHEQVVSV